MWTYDDERSQWKLNAVESLLVHQYDGDLVTLTIDNEQIDTTAGHPFRVVDGEQIQNRDKSQENAELSATSSGYWIEARNLRRGDTLMGRDGRLLELSAVSNRHFQGTVYNLSIASIHNYTVGTLGTLVHNKSAPNTGPWRAGTYKDALESLNEHFLRHGAEVGAKDAAQYLRKAKEFAKNLKRAKKDPSLGPTPGVTKYRKLGKYVELDSDGGIYSFGRQ